MTCGRLTNIALAVCSLSASAAAPGATDNATLVLQNPHLRAVIDRRGGALVSLESKGSKPCKVKSTIAESVVFQNGHILAVTNLHRTKQGRGPAGAVSFAAFLPGNALAGAVPSGRSDIPYFRADRIDKIRLTRTYRLEQDAPVLEVGYRLENTGNEEITFCLRLERGFGKAKGKAFPSITPTTEGVKRREFSYEYDTTAPWVAFTGNDVTVVTTFDDKYTSCIGHANGDSPGGAVTTVMSLAPGAVWATTTRIIYLPGLTGLAGITEDLALQIALPTPPLVPWGALKDKPDTETDLLDMTEDDDLDMDLDEHSPSSALDSLIPLPPTTNRRAYLARKPIKFRLLCTGLKSVTGSLRCTVKHMGSKTSTKLLAGKLTLESGKTKSIPVTFTPDREGTWVLRVMLVSKKQVVASFEQPLIIDYPTGTYLTKPATHKRMGVVFDRFRYDRYRWPANFDPLSMAFPLTDRMPTAHIPYAKPLSGGPLRVLICIPHRRAREAVELQQRLHCRMDSVIIGGHQYVGPGSGSTPDPAKARGPVEEVRAMRRALAKKPEVILLARVAWLWFPYDVRREILRQVAEDGTGLLFCSPFGLPHEFKSLFGASIETRAMYPAIERFGNGLMGFRPGQAATPQIEGIFARTEESLEAVCRALVFLGRGQPAVEMDWPPAATYSGSYTITLKNPGEEPFSGSLVVQAWLDRALTYPGTYGQATEQMSPYAVLEERAAATKKVALAPGQQQQVKLNLPSVPNGTYRVLAFAKDAAGGIITWLAQKQSTRAPFDIRNVRIVNLEQRDALRLYRGDQAEISFDVVPKRSVPSAELTAFVVGFDRSGREVLRSRKSLGRLSGETQVALQAPLQRALHRHFILRAGIEMDGRTLAEHRIPVMVDRTNRVNKFRFVLLDNENWFPHNTVLVDDFAQGGLWEVARVDGRGWGYGGFHGDPLALSAEEYEALEAARIGEEAKQAAAGEALMTGGLDGGVDGELEDELLDELLDDLADEDEAPEEAPQKPVERLAFTRSDCYNNPTNRSIYRQALLTKIRASSIGWPQRTFVDDEYVFGTLNTCQCGHCQKAFGHYLARSYGSIQRLNREWRVRFKSFSEARLYNFGDEAIPLGEQKPPPEEHWPQAVDTLTYKAQQYHDCAVALKQEVQKTVDPAYDIGVSGVFKMERGSFLSAGIDHWLMASIGKCHGVYRDYEEWSSFMGTPSVFTWQSGYGRNYNPSHQAWHPWYKLSRGEYGIGHFTSQAYPMASPDGALHVGPRTFFKNWDEIREGPGALLLGHEVRDPIAIHWSGPSFYLCGVQNWTLGGDLNGTLLRSMNHSLPSFVDDQRVRKYYISHAQLEKDYKTFWGPPKVIIMNYCNAVSMKEAATLRRFVEQGGVLLAGVDTATRTEHGAPYATPPLDELFGIVHQDGFEHVRLRKSDNDPSMQVKMLLPDQDAELSFVPWAVNANVAAVAGTSHGRWGSREQGGPVFIVNRHGKGTAIYLNFPLAYFGYNERNAITDWVFRYAGVNPFAKIEGDNKMLTRFRDGRSYYVCLLAPYGKDPRFYGELNGRIKVTLDDPRHLYDMRTGKYLGKAAAIPVDFRKQVARIYSCLEYKVDALAVRSPGSVKQGTDIRTGAELTADGPPGRHVFRVDVFRPDGKRQRILGYNQEAPGGKATIELPLAYNAPPGTWRLRVRDVATGLQDEASFTVVPQ